MSIKDWIADLFGKHDSPPDPPALTIPPELLAPNPAPLPPVSPVEPPQKAESAQTTPDTLRLPTGPIRARSSLPCPTIDYGGNCGLGNAKHHCHLVLRILTGRRQSPDLPSTLSGQFIPRSPIGVLNPGHHLDMVGIDTRPLTAQMISLKPWWNHTILALIVDAMRKKILPGNLQFAVAASIDSESPNPARRFIAAILNGVRGISGDVPSPRPMALEVEQRSSTNPSLARIVFWRKSCWRSATALAQTSRNVDRLWVRHDLTSSTGRGVRRDRGVHSAAGRFACPNYTTFRRMYAEIVP